EMSERSSVASMRVARFALRRRPKIQTAPPSQPADHLKTRIDDQCIVSIGQRRPFRAVTFARAQTSMRDKACGLWNREWRGAGEEIAAAPEASRCRQALRPAGRSRAPARARARR